MCDSSAVMLRVVVSARLQAYAKLQYNPGRELLEAAGRRALAALHQYTPQVGTNTCLFSMCRGPLTSHHPGQGKL